jgi:hypothetical protein
VGGQIFPGLAVPLYVGARKICAAVLARLQAAAADDSIPGKRANHEIFLIYGFV